MLDLQINLPKAFCDALLAKLDRLLLILEHQFPLPQITARDLQPEPPEEERFHIADDQVLWEMERAEAHYRQRTGQFPTAKELEAEIQQLREEI